MLCACRILAATVFLAEAGSAAAWMKRASERNAMKRFSVICLQCGLSVNRLIEAETAQTEIHPVTYQQKCKIAPNAADFDCPELERAVERSRRWDPIFRGGVSRPASNNDAVVFPKAWSEAGAKDQKPVVEKTDLSVEATDLHASVGVTDTVN